MDSSAGDPCPDPTLAGKEAKGQESQPRNARPRDVCGDHQLDQNHPVLEQQGCLPALSGSQVCLTLPHQWSSQGGRPAASVSAGGRSKSKSLSPAQAFRIRRIRNSRVGDERSVFELIVQSILPRAPICELLHCIRRPAEVKL